MIVRLLIQKPVTLLRISIGVVLKWIPRSDVSAFAGMTEGAREPQTRAYQPPPPPPREEPPDEPEEEPGATDEEAIAELNDPDSAREKPLS